MRERGPPAGEKPTVEAVFDKSRKGALLWKLGTFALDEEERSADASPSIAMRDNERCAGRAVSEHREPAGVDSSVVRLLAQPEVGATVASECLPKQPVGFVDVSGDVDRPAGKRRDERDVLGRLVRAPLVRCVVRRADAEGRAR